MMNFDVAADLKRAVRLLDAHGWCQGNGYTDDGKVCAETAICIATGYITLYNDDISRARIMINHEECERERAAIAAMRDQLPPGPWKNIVFMFNDDEHTTVEDVKLLFKRTIEAECDKR